MKSGLGRINSLGVAAAAAGALCLPLLTAGTAAATTTYNVSNNCDTNNVSDCWAGTNVLYVHYNSVDANGWTSSARAQFLGNVYDYAGTYYSPNQAIAYYYSYVFDNDGNGAGQAVKNNAASVLACSSVANYRVYYNSGYQGHSQYISGDWGCDNGVNLDSTLKNENASQHWG